MNILDNLNEDELKAMLAKAREEGRREAYEKCIAICEKYMWKWVGYAQNGAKTIKQSILQTMEKN